MKLYLVVPTSLRIIVHHIQQTSLFSLGVVTPMFMTPMSFEHCFGSSASNIIVEAIAHAIWNIIKWFLNLLWYILTGNQSTTLHWGDKT